MTLYFYQKIIDDQRHDVKGKIGVLLAKKYKVEI